MGGRPELAYLTSLRDPSPSSTFQCSSLMGQDPSGCVEHSLGRWVCRHLVVGASCLAWRSGIAGERTECFVVLEVARAGRGQLWPSKPYCPTWHLTGVCAANWNLVRGGPAYSDLHMLPVPGTPWVAKQPLLGHVVDIFPHLGASAAFFLGTQHFSCGSSRYLSTSMPWNRWGLGVACDWQPPSIGTWKLR